jgi:hypothetical protein
MGREGSRRECPSPKEEGREERARSGIVDRGIATSVGMRWVGRIAVEG